MKVALNTFVDFHGDFPKRDFREGTPGREVAEFLAAGLRDRGIEVQGVEDVDSAHCIDCVAARSIASLLVCTGLSALYAFLAALLRGPST